MLSAALERVIMKGKARYHTFTYGVGGVGRIDVPQGSFIIITDFDYFHFVDIKPSIPATPAIGDFTFDTGPFGPIPIAYSVAGVPAVPSYVLFNPGDVPTTTTDFNNYLAANLPGFTASVVLVGTVFTITVTTTPGTMYNGILATVTPVFPFAIIVTPFAGGADANFQFSDLTDASTHQMELRSEKSRNHYVIQENVIYDALSDPSQLIYNVFGMYHRDVYLVHTAHVQIDIIRVPRPTNWAVTYSQLDNKSQENANPVGYGIAPAGMPTVRQVDFNGLGEFYKPLSNAFDELNALPSQTEFKVDAIPGRELRDPTLALPIFVNGRNYPTVNIGYVMVDMNWNEFVKQS